MFDRITSVEWDLPDGVVVTMMDNVPDNFDAALKDGGRHYDMHKKASYNNISFRGVNDRMSSYTMYTVDTDLGLVSLFEADDFRANYKFLYLSLFEPNVIHDMRGWFMADRISSLGVRTIDTGIVTFYENSDGSGKQFTVTGSQSDLNIEKLGLF